MYKIIMLALAIATLASSAYSADEGLWESWGAAPYAHSLTEAFQKASTDIDGFDWKPEVKEHFKSVLADTSKYRSTVVYLTPNMLLEEMWSGKDSKHPTAYIMQKRTVAELPVFKSPDGRRYRPGAVFETAKALSWSWAFEGETTVFCFPFECLNACWFYGPPPVSVPDKCVEIEFNAPVGGKVRWGVASTNGPLLPSICNAQRQGDGPWTAWLGQCDICIRTLGSMMFIRTILGGQADIPHKFVYKVTDTHQTLRFTTAIWADVVYICLEYPDWSQTMGVYIRPQDWGKGQYEFFVQDRFWVSDKDYKE
jgi:hypothetical protein